MTDALYTPYDYAETIYRKLGFSGGQERRLDTSLFVPPRKASPQGQLF